MTHLYGPAVCCKSEVSDGVDWSCASVIRPVNRAFVLLATMDIRAAEGIVVVDEPENVVNQKMIIELTEKNRLPAIYKMFVQAGGLMSYGIDVGDQGRRLADVVSEILKGARPGEIPISQPTKFELIINLKTAKALGLTVPATMLVAADEVIE